MSTGKHRSRSKQRRKRAIRNTILIALIIIAFILDIIMIFVVSDRIRKNPANTPDVIIETETDTNKTPSQGQAETDVQTDPADTTEAAANDVTAPVIRGESNIYVAKGSKVRYKSYIYVEDDMDPDPQIDIDNSDVDLSREGTYKLIYTVTDASGNSSSKTVNVVVGAQEEPNVPDEEIYALADKVLATIIEDDMTDLEKVFAVFYYVRNTFSYVKDDNYWEYKQEAYQMMTTLQDNCYANVCVSKLLLERLGFESFMIQGELGYVDEHHYWNMVSIDGGVSWYHYDAAWWTWMRDEYPLCMLTDEFAEEISEKHGGLWIYDHDAFPATPKEALWTVDELKTNSRLTNR